MRMDRRTSTFSGKPAFQGRARNGIVFIPGMRMGKRHRKYKAADGTIRIARIGKPLAVPPASPKTKKTTRKPSLASQLVATIKGGK